eukprot:TRINITY_DN23787_c0_g1_i1.p1 TRINITY_DN23787_c0_g1~~TRINITY_DN23787_c0_g1_i1.p1  ORF type:complete len:152 (+),score=5.89 TRINITY_DN23787_c0_g1_i1:308-763(+)
MQTQRMGMAELLQTCQEEKQAATLKHDGTTVGQRFLSDGTVLGEGSFAYVVSGKDAHSGRGGHSARAEGAARPALSSPGGRPRPLSPCRVRPRRPDGRPCDPCRSRVGGESAAVSLLRACDRQLAGLRRAGTALTQMGLLCPEAAGSARRT